MRHAVPDRWCHKISKEACNTAYVMQENNPEMKAPCVWDEGRHGCYATEYMRCPELQSEPPRTPEVQSRLEQTYSSATSKKRYETPTLPPPERTQHGRRHAQQAVN